MWLFYNVADTDRTFSGHSGAGRWSDKGVATHEALID